MKTHMMVFCIVGDDYNAASCLITYAVKSFKEIGKTHSIESFGSPLPEKLAVSETDCTEVANRAPSRVVQ